MDEGERIDVPENMCCNPNTLEKLIMETYPNIHLANRSNQYFMERTILCCKNDDVDSINKTILEIMPGREKVLPSADSVDVANQNQDGYQPYPVEYLNSLTASGLPLSKLSLKIGCPVMLLRNLDPSKGLCNGTRMIVKDIKNRVLKCEIISGDARFSGNIALIPGSHWSHLLKTCPSL
jgi:ATP-dependent DNA helicase PIF1